MTKTLKKQMAIVADRLDAMDKYVFAGTVRKAMVENAELRQHLTTAQAEIEALRGRVAELEAAFAGASDLIMRIHNALHYGEIYQWNDGRECWQEMDDFADGYRHSAWLLRKQAEAVDPHWPKSQAIMIKDDARSRAYELKQQADEAEKAGGGE